MIRTPIFAANWKMNHGPSEARAFLKIFCDRYSPRDDRTVVFFPSALAFAAAREGAGTRQDFAFGVQNIGTEPGGAFTGENSASMAQDAGATWVLVGHSERRHVFGETDEQTAAKCAMAMEAGLTPMLCVGETLAQREAGETDAVVVAQLTAGLHRLSPAQRNQVVIAYEPVWAIGTGRNATPADASAGHRTRGAARSPRGGTGGVPVLYGGSVNPRNAAALLEATGVDGLLVGGASLDPESWLAVVSAT
jgi:triosephosphate isomerase